MRAWINERSYDFKEFPGQQIAGVYGLLRRGEVLWGFNDGCVYPDPAEAEHQSLLRSWKVQGSKAADGSWSVSADVDSQVGATTHPWMKAESFRATLTPSGGTLVDTATAGTTSADRRVFHRRRGAGEDAVSAARRVVDRIDNGECEVTYEEIFGNRATRSGIAELCNLRGSMRAIAGRVVSTNLQEAIRFDRMPVTYPMSAPDPVLEDRSGALVLMIATFENSEGLPVAALVVRGDSGWRVIDLWW